MNFGNLEAHRVIPLSDDTVAMRELDDGSMDT